MLKKTVKGALIVTALMFTASAARAGDLFSNIQGDVFALGGASTLIDPFYFGSAGRLYHSELLWGPKFTLGVSFPYGKILSIETSYSQGPDNLEVTNLDLTPRQGVHYAVTTYIGNLSAVIHVPYSWKHIRPYVDGGVEYDRFSPSQAAITYALEHGFASASSVTINHNDKLGLSAGGGVERKIYKRLSLRVDLRDHVTSSPAFGLPPTAITDNPVGFPTFTHRANNVEYTAGITWHFGKQ